MTNRDTRAPAYSEKELSRRSSTASSLASRNSCASHISARGSVSSTISDVTPPTSRAPSITSQASFVSRYLEQRHASLLAANAPITEPRQAKYTDIMSKPELQPINVYGISNRTGKKRIVNLRLRKITEGETEHYNSRTIASKQTFYIDKALATEPGLYKPAARYMLDFDIVDDAAPIPCSVRLSCCEPWGLNNNAPLLHILRYSQRNLDEISTSVHLPLGLYLHRAEFPCGISGSRPKACSGQIAIDMNVPEEGMSVHSAAVTKFNCAADYYDRASHSEEERSSKVKERALESPWYHWTVTIHLPPATMYRPGDSRRELKWKQLQGLDTAFPDSMYGKDDETIEKWLGPIGARNRYQHFEARDIKFNLKGEIISARLVKIAGPKSLPRPRPSRPAASLHKSTESSQAPTPVTRQLIEEAVEAAKRNARQQQAEAAKRDARQQGGGLFSRIGRSRRDKD